VLVRTDLQCRWSIDGKPQGVLSVDDRVTVSLGIGEHLMEAVPLSGGPLWEQVLSISDTNARVFTIPLLAAKNAEELRKTLAATRERGYWLDPETGLTWEAAASVSSVNWFEGAKQCRDLRLAGYSDWQLPTIEELNQLRVARGHTAKGGIQADAYVWSTSQGKTPREAWLLDFGLGLGRMSAKLSYRGSGPLPTQALCVRGNVPK